MSFITPDFQSIRDGILRDIQNQLPDANARSDGDYAIRANATASAVEGLYQHQQWIARQIFPDTADQDNLERHAGMRGINRKAATPSTGTVTFSGVAGSAIPIGTEVKSGTGVAFLTTSAGVIGAGGTVDLAVQCELPGASGNLTFGTSMTLTSAPNGVLSGAVVANISGGTETESNSSLLSRLLFRLRNPPCGGAAHDYYSWALNVSGVTAAYVYPNRRGLGTTDVAVLTNAGIPSGALVAAVQSYIDSQRPVQAGFLAMAPAAVPVSITGTLVLAAGYALASVSAAINVALATYFSTLKPGDTVYLKRLVQIIASVAGVVDFNLTAPTANVTTIVDSTRVQLATLGAMTWA